MKAQSTFSLKDQLFNATTVASLTTRLKAVHPAFPADAFQASVMAAFPALELKARISHISAVLRDCLPPRYLDALAIILEALPPPLDPDRTDGDYGDFIIAPLSLFVADHGCTRAYLDVSLDALKQITARFSAEDAVRYFLNAFPAQTLEFLRACARDDNYHVRRLSSEGTRPLLPWARRLTIDYHEPLPILDLLFTDRTRYVTRSVANHLNDISKLDPQLVIDTLCRWRNSPHQTPAEMLFITQHALRTLVKRGHAGALEHMGFGEDPNIAIADFATSTPRVRVGDAFRFSLTLKANGPQNLLIDYVMTFAGAGQRARRKVFKLKQVELNEHETVTITKSHPMRLMTTRRLHAGEHLVTLQINGQPRGTLAFDLEE
jgi:3-methyladenine DNA glycosylase AlkC